MIMTFFKNRSILVVSLFIFILLSPVLMACSGANSSLPVYDQIPPSVEFSQLVSELQSNPQATATKYGGEYHLFLGVPAEIVASRRNTNAMTPGKLFVQSGCVRFLPEYTRNLDDIGDGFLLDIVGKVTPWIQGPFFIIDDCTYVIVEGGELPPSSY
jgi:hypothetical protein